MAAVTRVIVAVVNEAVFLVTVVVVVVTVPMNGNVSGGGSDSCSGGFGCNLFRNWVGSW